MRAWRARPRGSWCRTLRPISSRYLLPTRIKLTRLRGVSSLMRMAVRTLSVESSAGWVDRVDSRDRRRCVHSCACHWNGGSAVPTVEPGFAGDSVDRWRHPRNGRLRWVIAHGPFRRVSDQFCCPARLKWSVHPHRICGHWVRCHEPGVDCDSVRTRVYVDETHREGFMTQPRVQLSWPLRHACWAIS
jgi:hypothetical protein